MKIGVVYTSTTPELIELVERELRAQVGDEAVFLNYQDPSILADVREAGVVTAGATAKLVGLYVQAIQDGADAILNCCSSVGGVADCVQDMARYTGVPIVRIDEDMCREAVRLAVKAGKRIGVMATLATTLEPTKDTLIRVAREMNVRVTLVDALLEGAFGLSPDEFTARMRAKALSVADQVDVLLFAQGSMAYCEAPVHEATGKPVVSSPRFGAPALRLALEVKGLI